MKKTIGYGLIIWILIFVIVSALIVFKLYDSLLVKIIVAVISGIIAYVLAGKVPLATVGKALTYGAIWVVVGLVLDYIITVRFNAAIFSEWSLWLGYALVLLAPTLQVKRIPRL